MTLPPLPEPNFPMSRRWDEEQLKEYALAVLEAAARMCEVIGKNFPYGDYPHLDCAKAIRAMKEEHPRAK
jgi:hypothetical protein